MNDSLDFIAKPLEGFLDIGLNVIALPNALFRL